MGPRIAVVDDNPCNRLVIQLLLEDHNFQVDLFESGAQALHALPENVPELVILDLCMPDMDGQETLARIRCTPALRDLPVIAFSAQAEGRRSAILNQGFDDFASKPIVDEVKFLALITKHLKLPCSSNTALR